MKKIIVIFLGIISFNCSSQNTVDSSTLTINGINVIGKKKPILIQHFGQPVKIDKDFSEMSNEDMYLHHYNGVIFYVINDLVDDYEILNSNFKFTKHNIKIGENINRLKRIYPISFNKKGEEHLTIWLKDPNDKYVHIAYDKNSKLITKIYIRTY
ncbi:hypothetical protein [Maribacter sp. 2304DJ31-5]|uniref:hypothetical protein n=1 Tax=Maribacter sp. 2304DJ31-5 TaxID=3386273 RepID=UPI0039BC3EC8